MSFVFLVLHETSKACPQCLILLFRTIPFSTMTDYFEGMTRVTASSSPDTETERIRAHIIIIIPKAWRIAIAESTTGCCFCFVVVVLQSSHLKVVWSSGCCKAELWFTLPSSFAKVAQRRRRWWSRRRSSGGVEQLRPEMRLSWHWRRRRGKKSCPRRRNRDFCNRKGQSIVWSLFKLWCIRMPADAS